MEFVGIMGVLESIFELFLQIMKIKAYTQLSQYHFLLNSQLKTRNDRLLFAHSDFVHGTKK